MINKEKLKKYNYAKITLDLDDYFLIQLHEKNKDIIVNELPKYIGEYWKDIPEYINNVISVPNFIIDIIDDCILKKIELLSIVDIREIKKDDIEPKKIGLKK